jgi:hypothetical protein
VAQLSAGIQTYTNGKPVGKQQQFRLGEDQADAELRSRSGTTAMASLFADGSGTITIHRGGAKYTLRWSADDPTNPDGVHFGTEYPLDVPEVLP